MVLYWYTGITVYCTRIVEWKYVERLLRQPTGGYQKGSEKAEEKGK